MQQDIEVQDIFNRVIAAGLYGDGHGGACEYMCNSLGAASMRKIITRDECLLAQQAIRLYLQAVEESDTLRGALMTRDLPAHQEARLAIYLDWANRPSLEVCDAEH